MKGLLLSFSMLLFIMSSSDVALAQAAQAQFIHGSADPSLTKVDIYVNDTVLVSQLSFRQATSYIDLPTDIEFILSVSRSGEGPDAALYRFEKALADSARLFNIFLRGVVDTTLFSPNPDTNELRSTALQFRINPGARIIPPGDPQKTWVYFYNGVTDASAFNIWASADSTILSTIGPLQYSDFTGYVPRARGPMVFDRVNAFDNTILDSYLLDLSGVQNSTVAIFTTGFMDPASNQNGAELQFHAALADGTVLSSNIVTSNDGHIPRNYGLNSASAYPNPVARKVNFALAQNLDVRQLDIYDSLGRVVKTVKGKKQNINVDGLPIGMYHVMIEDNTGGIHLSSFFLK